jgi:hypothetical protein
MLRTGLKTLIGLSVVGIGIGVLLIYTCPFVGRIAFSAGVRQVPMEHAGGGEHARRPGVGAEEAHKETPDRAQAAAGHPDEHKRFNVHFTMIPNARRYPLKETNVAGVEVAPLGILALLVVIALSVLILRQRPWSLFGHRVTPQAMGMMLLLITAWNLVVAAFLLGVEVVQFREL